jgi:hypothetical protein
MSATALACFDVAVASARTLTSRPNGATARLRRAVDVAGDVLLAAAVVLCIPFVILAVGIPIALFVQLLIWIARVI